jgi:hypothetical protein
MLETITRACGHTETVQIYGSAAERSKKIEWYKSTDCSNCWKSEGCSEVEMSYSEYKNNYADCKTKKDSYNKAAKTIIVYVPDKKNEETTDPASVEKIEEITEELIETAQAVAEKDASKSEHAKQAINDINFVLNHIKRKITENHLHGTDFEIMQKAFGLDLRPQNMTRGQHEIVRILLAKLK